MALASQMPRTNDAGRVRAGAMYHKRRVSRAPVLIGAVILAGLFVGWWLLKPSSPSTVVGATLEDDRNSVVEPQNTATPRQTLGSAAPLLKPTGDTTANNAPPTQAATNANPPAVLEMGSRPATDASAALPDPTIPSNPTPSELTGSAGGAPTTTATNPPQASPQQQPVAQGPIAAMISEAARQESAGRPVEARATLNRALHDSRATESERDAIRDRMGKLSDLILFSSTPVAGDPYTTSAVVQAGDTLTKITASNNLQTDWRFVMRVNNIAAPNRLAVGQKLKLIKGPFHAVVSKSAFRLDLYIGEPDASGHRMFVRSFPVGLGEFGSTPIASFIVRPNSKLINPSWRNPRTGEFFTADDPKNPLGEYWIGLDPADQASAQYVDYGLHGTIDPDSIGYEKSMGCVRLAEPDIRLLYETLIDRVSTVRIAP